MGNQAFANPTLDETSELDVWQLFQKNILLDESRRWLFFPRSLIPVRNVFGVQAKAVCGQKSGAPALGFEPLCSIPE